MKFCHKCQQSLAETAFSKNKCTKDGLAHPCKQCVKKHDQVHYLKNKEKKRLQVEEWRKLNPDKVREISRTGAKRRRIKNPQKFIEHTKKYQLANPEKVRIWKRKSNAQYKKKYPHKTRAQNLVLEAIEKGLLIRQPCEICKNKYGKEVYGQAHHSDYNKPLDVIWLCPKHHSAWHKVFITDDVVISGESA